MFETDADFERTDWRLLQNGAVNLFHSRDILMEARGDLEALGYNICQAKCESGWASFCEQVSRELDWEAQFGYFPWTGNLNAFDDAIRGFPFTESKRGAFLVDDFHILATKEVEFARSFLDVLETAARSHLLEGRLFIALIRTDDGNYESGPIGCSGAQWNPREWPKTRRSG